MNKHIEKNGGSKKKSQWTKRVKKRSSDSLEENTY